MSAGLLSIGRGALLTAYAQLQTTGHNIANASTPGYSRQEVVTASAGADFSGAGFVGRGVDVVDVRRRYDRFVAAEVATGTAASGADDARAAQLARMEKLFSDPSTGIGAAFDDLNLALADVANRPADPGTRGVVLARAEALAGRVRDVDAGLSDVAATIEGRLGQQVRSANDTLARLARLNEQIMQSGSSTVQPNDLLDQRDQLLVEVNQSLKANAYIGDNGTVSVFAAGGQSLVAGSRAAQLALQPDPADPEKSRVALQVDGTAIRMDTAALGGGALAGLLRARDEDLGAMRTRIDQIAAGIATAYNDCQHAGLDANGVPGADLFGYDPNAGAASLRCTLAAPEGLATALSMSPQLGAGNTGTLRVAAFSSDPVSATPTTVYFTSDTTYDLPGTWPPVTGAPYTPGSPIVSGGWSMTLTGTPRAGDTVSVVRNPDPAVDNRNARAMADLSTRGIVGGATVADAYAAAIADVGTRSQSAQAAQSMSQRLLDNAQAARADVAGVNLDEEAARLLQYQQAYQAAAKVIQAAQSMFDSLLQAVG